MLIYAARPRQGLAQHRRMKTMTLRLSHAFCLFVLMAGTAYGQAAPRWLPADAKYPELGWYDANSVSHDENGFVHVTVSDATGPAPPAPAQYYHGAWNLVVNCRTGDYIRGDNQ